MARIRGPGSEFDLLADSKANLSDSSSTENPGTKAPSLSDFGDVAQVQTKVGESVVGQPGLAASLTGDVAVRKPKVVRVTTTPLDSSAKTGGSTGSGEARVASKGRTLPDLSNKLQQIGLFEEYQRQRHAYMKWRQWWNNRDIQVMGAKGEITCATALLKQEETMAQFRGWYKDVAQWKWQRTCSYWVAVTFLNGALLFTVSSYAMCFPRLSLPPFDVILPRIAFVGNVFFTAGMYLMLLSVANFNQHDTDVENYNYNPLAYRSVVQHLENVKVHKNSYHITLVYMVGVGMYNPYCLLPVLQTDMPDWVEYWFSVMPCIIGGFFFWLGGMLEMKENLVWPLSLCAREKDGNRHIPLIAQVNSICNALGGLLFFLPAAFDWFHVYEMLGLVAADGAWWDGLLWGTGALFYAVGGVLSILMWKNDQFGLAYISVLNTGRGADADDEEGDDLEGELSPEENARRQSPTPEKKRRSSKAFIALKEVSTKRKIKKKLSFRTVAMITWCCVFGCCALVDFFLEAHFHFSSSKLYDASSIIAYIFHLFWEFFPFLIYFLALILMSAVPHVPREQPFRFLMFSIRWLLVILALDLIHRAVAHYYRLSRAAQ